MGNVLRTTMVAAAVLFFSMAAFAEEQVEPQVEPQTAGLVITRAETRGAVEGDVARLHMTIEAESYRDGEQSAPLLAGAFPLADWSVKGRFFGGDAFIRPNRSGGLDLVAQGTGRYTVNLELVIPVDDARPGRSVKLPVVEALASTTVVTLPGRDLEVAPVAGASMESHVRGAETEVSIYGGAGSIQLAWKPKAPERARAPLVFADQTMAVQIGEGVMRIESEIVYTIVQGRINELKVRLPADVSLLNVEGPSVRAWDALEEAGGATRLLTVALLGDAEKEATLSLRIEKVLPQVAMTVELPAVELLNVVREKGQIAVAAAKGISVESATAETVSPIDVRDMKAPALLAGQEVRLGFRYLKRPFTLALRTDRVAAKTSAEVLALVRAGLDVVRQTTTVRYGIRDAGVFQFRVTLDPGLKLIDIQGLNINNWELDETSRILTVALRSKAEGQYALVLETEMEKPSGEKVGLPAVHALDVDRESGYVAVLSAPGVKVETASLSGIGQVDVKELPQELLAASPALAFRYIRPGYQLAVNVAEIEPEVQAEVRTVASLSEHDLSLETEIIYTIRRAGIFQLRVAVPKELRRTNVEGPEIDDTSWDEAAGVLTVNLRSKVADSYTLKLNTEKTLEGIEAGVVIPNIRTVDVKKERGFIAVVPKTSVRLKPAEGKMTGLDNVSVSDLPPEMLKRAGQVALAFKYFSQPWDLGLAVEPIEPRLTAEVFNLVSIGEKLMTVSATVSYNILHAGVDAFTIKLPPGATAVDIEGDGIKLREEDEAAGTWTVTLQSKLTGDYTLYASFQQKIAADQAVLPYPGVEAMNVQRETGYLAVTSRADVQLTVADADIENLTPIDGRELPATYMQGVVLPVLLAYRYVSHPYMIRIGATPHDAAEVTVAVIEAARLHTTVTEEGNMVTDLVCILRNSRQQYLDLKLPEDAEIWHAFVSGQGVTPLRDDELTKIPVARAAGRDEPFEVRLRYSGRRDDLGRLGRIGLESPMQGIDIMRLGWTLSLPDGYDMVNASGNLRPLLPGRAMEAQLSALNPDVEVQQHVVRDLSLSQVKAPQSMHNYRAQNEALGGGRQERRSIYTGAAPGQARRFQFQGLIVSARQPAEAKVTYVKRSIGLPMKGLELLLLIVGAGIIWLLARRSCMLTSAVLIVLMLLALAARTLAEGGYRSYWTIAVVTLFCLAVLSIFSAAARAIARWWSRRKQAPAPVEAPQPMKEDEEA